MCKEDIYFNCKKFNKSKDILINSDDKIYFRLCKKNFYDFFSISDLSISFFNLNIDVNNFKNITDIKVFNQSIKSNDILEKKKKKFFYYK